MGKYGRPPLATAGLLIHYAVHNMEYVQLPQELLSILLFVYSLTQLAYRPNIFYIK